MGKYYQAIIIIVLLAAHVVLGLGAIRANSPTYDEAVHLASGYSYLKANDYRINSEGHPPFAKMWAALPLLFMRASLPVQHPYWNNVHELQYQFSDIFLYHNKVNPEKMINSGRLMMLLLSCALGLLIFFCSKTMFGPLSGLLALALWCFMPAAVANGTLITTDMALTLFFFSTMYAFMLVYKENESGGKTGWGRTALLGLNLGLLFASKFSALGILPALALLLVYLYSRDRKAALRVFKALIAASVPALAVLALSYRFNDLGVFYFDGLQKVLSGINTGRSSFLMGQYSVKGWFYYFPVAFVLKTPIPFLLMLAAAACFKKSWRRDNVLFLLLPAAVFFGLSCYSKMQIGHRHILPIYPFMIVWASGIVAYGINKYIKGALAALFILFAISGIRAYPWYISYFNELIASPNEGYRYMTDSNLDWGQGLKELGKYLKTESAGGVYLCYFGTGDPSYYGIRYVPIGFIDNISPPHTENGRAGDKIDFSKEKKILFAISATNLQATYYADKKVFSFLKTIKPQKVVANSIFVYDLTANPEAYEKLKALTAGR